MVLADGWCQRAGARLSRVLESTGRESGSVIESGRLSKGLMVGLGLVRTHLSQTAGLRLRFTQRWSGRSGVQQVRELDQPLPRGGEGAGQRKA